MIGIHINDRDSPFTEMILNKQKTLETRFKPTLRPFVGQRVAIIRTGRKATIVGTVEIVSEEWMDAEKFGKAEQLHCATGTRWNSSTGKWCYKLANPQRIEPIVIGSQYFTGNRIYRRVP